MNNIDGLIEHIDFLARNLSSFDETYVVKILLLEVGIPERGNSFDYVEEAVLLWYRDSMRYLSKEIYPTIAKKFGVHATISQTERTIRLAITRAWENRDEIWEVYFPNSQKPTNTEFISRMAKMLEMWRSHSEMLKCVEGGR